MNLHKEEYCTECTKYRKEKNFTIHNAINKNIRKRCDFCHEKSRSNFQKSIVASIAESRSSKNKAECINPEKGKTRRRIEELHELQKIKKEFE